jgi:hypothetical protein
MPCFQGAGHQGRRLDVRFQRGASAFPESGVHYAACFVPVIPIIHAAGLR